ncbi:hypothetical protein [Sphingomonas sp.]|uniref:hypothetical protein n=1 Tax=Sphingomonas sp. TaxID=28214 RepID=UPI0025DDA243|nr:hypothetical protein [Sphingomonas sp.]
MATAPIHTDPAEGPREDEPAAGKGRFDDGGQGVSAPEPAEGADDAPAGGPDSPR